MSSTLGHHYQEQQTSLQKRKRTHTRNAEWQAKLNGKRIKRYEGFFKKRMRGRPGHEDVKKEMCFGGFKLKIEMRAPGLMRMCPCQ